MDFSDFRKKFAKDERFRAVERYTDQKDFFNSYADELRDKERIAKREKAENAKKEFLQLLTSVKDLHRKSDWYKVKPQISDDARYGAVESSSQRAAYFDDYRRTLPKRPKRKPSPGEIVTDDDDDDAGAASGGGSDTLTTKRPRKKSPDAERHEDDVVDNKRKEKRRSVEDRRSGEKQSAKSKRKEDDDASKSGRTGTKSSKRGREISDVDREDADEDDRHDAGVGEKDIRRHRRERDRRSGSHCHRHGDERKRTRHRSGGRIATEENNDADGESRSDRRDKRRMHATSGRRDRRSASGGSVDDADGKRRSTPVLGGADRVKSADNVKSSGNTRKIRGDSNELSDSVGLNGDFDRPRDKNRYRSRTPSEADEVKDRKANGRSLKRRATLSPVDEGNERKVDRYSAKKRKSTNIADDKELLDAGGELRKVKKDRSESDGDDLKAVVRSRKSNSAADDDADVLSPRKLGGGADDYDDDDDDEEDRAAAAAEAERQARFDASLRKRREEVEQKMSSINMETQRERQQSKLNEARAAYQQLLNDHVRTFIYLCNKSKHVTQ